MARGGALSGSSALIERTSELAEIDRSLRDAKAGGGHMLLIEGPPGIGKTALLRAAEQRAQRRRMVTLSARGGELEGHFSYGVVRQLFERFLLEADAATRRALFRGAAALAKPALTGTGELDAEPRDDAAFGFVHGLYWLTVNLSQRTPLLIAIDDVQWADAPSLRFLLHLSRRLEGVAASLVVSFESGGPRVCARPRGAPHRRALGANAAARAAQRGGRRGTPRLRP